MVDGQYIWLLCDLGPGAFPLWSSVFHQGRSESGLWLQQMPSVLSLMWNGSLAGRAPTNAVSLLPTASSYGVREVNQVKRLTGPGLSKGPEPNISVMITGGPWPTR